MAQPQPQKLTKFGQAFVSYGSYHYDTVNKIIHIICIPLIAATLFALLGFVPYSFTFYNVPVVGHFSFGAAEILGVIGVLYYMSLNFVFGILSAVFMIGASILWKGCFKDYEAGEYFRTIFIIQVVAWVLQFVGHGVFEKRKPALLDNLTQILNAPMFVMIELFEMFGLKTQEIEGWKALIKKNVEQYRQKSQKTN